VAPSTSVGLHCQVYSVLRSCLERKRVWKESMLATTRNIAYSARAGGNSEVLTQVKHGPYN